MSVYPEFLEYIHQVGMYVPGYNYEEMYNIMVYTLTYQINPTNHFIYTPQFMNQLYDYLEELLDPVEMTDVETESNEPPPILTHTNQMNQTNQMTHTNQTNQTNQMTHTNQTNQTALEAFNQYIITALNNPIHNHNNNQNQNQNLYNMNYNNMNHNIVYYNNT